MLDGVGIGALPDAHLYNDEGANTLNHVIEHNPNVTLPHLNELGLGNLLSSYHMQSIDPARGGYGKMAECSKGKDSTTGHWELAGLVTDEAFPTYPNGFPQDVVEIFLKETGCKGYLGNKVASGTEIIRELGDEHSRTGYPIIYTSADSVFQIAAHEEVIPLEKLYEICSVTRTKVMIGEHRIGRVIARPFIGKAGSYTRTVNRRDFAVEPPQPTLLDVLYENGIPTTGIGKIDDLFCGRGLSEAIHTHSNSEGISVTLEKSRSTTHGFIMTNLIDFDMLYGHRQDPIGFANALKEFDNALPELLATFKQDDALFITADHGNDPLDNSTDHTREYVPILTYSPGGKPNVNLCIRASFADVAQSVCDYFGIKAPTHFAGTSFYDQIR